MFTIAPIGSCRIATPLRLNRDVYGYEIDFNRNYGFCHSAAEAVQQLKYMDGEKEFPKDIWPLIARGKDRTLLGQQRKGDIDLFVVEVSSAKMLKVDDCCVQLNYLRNEYADFFSDFDRARNFWSINKTADQFKIDSYLKEHWSDGADQQEDSRMLRRVRMSIVDEDGLRRDIQWIMKTVPDVMFVTHVNALKPDNTPIASRENFIKMVSHVVRDEGGLVYDPTSRMQEFGQVAAIEDYSDSLAHFTPEFCYHFFADWYNLAIEPCIDSKVKLAGPAAIKTVLQPNVEALIENDKVAHLGDRLENLETVFSDDQLFAILRAQVDVANNKTNVAYDRLSKALNINPDNVEILGNLSEIAFEASDPALSLACFKKLVALDAPPSSEQLHAMGQVLVARGDLTLGLAFFEMSYFLSPMSRGLAKAYVQLAVRTNAERLADLGAEDHQRLVTRLDIGDLLSLAVARGETSDGDLPSSISSELAKLNAQQLLGVIRDLSSQIEPLFQVKLIAVWRKTQPQEKLVDRELRKLVDDVYQDRYAPNASIDEQLVVIEDTIAADPLHRDARIAMRGTRASLLSQARTFYKAGERAKLDLLADQVSLIAEPLPEVAVLQARLALAEDQFEIATQHALRAVAESAQSGIAWLTLVRSAHRAGDLITLSHACHSFLNLDDDINPAWEGEVRLRLERLPALALKAGRADDDPHQAYELLGLARADPEFVEVANLLRERIERKLAQDLRELNDADLDLDAFLDVAQPILRIVENGKSAEAAFVSVGRKLVKSRAFALAMPYWEKALSLSPNNENYLFQRDRCLDRTGNATASGLTDVQQAKG